MFVFRYSANYGEATEAQVLRACNLIDEFPVHARAEKDADGKVDYNKWLDGFAAQRV